jgi:hypothetical protein
MQVSGTPGVLFVLVCLWGGEWFDAMGEWVLWSALLSRPCNRGVV